tara:strand:+ start:490 stop:717 length:228 start_codon:yes stop_codon:yes gene_type:complete
MSRTYDRSWVEIDAMVEEATKRQNRHLMALQDKRLKKKQVRYHMRNYKGLEGVINMGEWVLGNKDMTKARVLGDE